MIHHSVETIMFHEFARLAAGVQKVFEVFFLFMIYLQDMSPVILP